MKKLFLLFIFCLLAPTVSQAALSPDQEGDCVIRNFESTFELQKDSSLQVEENVKVDCGNLAGKHGIFRILPLQASRPGGQFTGTAVRLESITDFEGKTYSYETITSRADNTITWKIGDADQTITGIHNYRIRYVVQNAISPIDNGKDQFYWNLSGAFWQLPIEHFSAILTLPTGASEANTDTTLYSGVLGATNAEYATISWLDTIRLKVESTQTLSPGEGITIQANFPKGNVNYYQPTFLELYGDWLWFIVPVLFFIIGMYLWLRFGKDPRMRGPVVVEYAPPIDMSPMETGFIDSAANMKNQYITATIIDLAVQGFVTIEETESKGILGMTSKDWKLTRTQKPATGLKEFEQTILRSIFTDDAPSMGTVNLSSVRTSAAIPKSLVTIISQVSGPLERIPVFDKRSKQTSVLIFILGFVMAGGILWFGIASQNFIPIIAAVLTVVVGILFGILMPRRTPAGAELARQIKGFKLYMAKAEKYRMQFYEKENIFEKYLPYAIVFGLTKQWAQSMKSIYGEQYNSMVPAWYIGHGVGTATAFDSFTSNLNSLSSQISAASTPPSSSGGGGFSGGGGGGGGGGSW